MREWGVGGELISRLPTCHCNFCFTPRILAEVESKGVMPRRAKRLTPGHNRIEPIRVYPALLKRSASYRLLTQREILKRSF